MLQFPRYLGGHLKICQYFVWTGRHKTQNNNPFEVYEYWIEANRQLNLLPTLCQCNLVGSWPSLLWGQSAGPSSNLLSTRTFKTFSSKSLPSYHLGVLNLFVTLTWVQVVLNFPVFSLDNRLEFPLILVSLFKQQCSPWFINCSTQMSLMCKLAKELHPLLKTFNSVGFRISPSQMPDSICKRSSSCHH